MQIKIRITKEELDKILSTKEPILVTNNEIEIGSVISCENTHEYYIVTSCQQKHKLYSWDTKYFIPNPNITIDLRYEIKKDWYFTEIYSLEKLAGTLSIDLHK